MNTKDAYEKFKQGLRVGVVVTNAVTKESSVVEIDAAGWNRRLKIVPNNTNYVVIEELWKCECCGAELTASEVEPYGDGFCHVVGEPDGFGGAEPVPCDPVIHHPVKRV